MNTPTKALPLFLRALLCSGALLLTAITTLHAGSASWILNPGSNDWNTAANWTPATVPNGPSDTATFGASNTTDVSCSAGTEISALNFNADASAFTFTPTPSVLLNISGTGITNNSTAIQTFVTTV